MSEAKVAEIPFEVDPITPSLGAEIRGLDLSRPLTAPERAALRAAWARHLVLILRDQTLDPDALLALARGFGRLDLAPPFDQEQSNLPGHPEIAVVSNVVENGRALGGLGHGELVWHSDMTYRAQPPVACVLSGVEIPPQGGATHFVSMVAALASLPRDLREAIADRSLWHDARYTSAGTERTGVTEARSARHPLIARDPLSGQDILLLGRRRQAAVAELSPEAGQILIDRLWDHVEGGDFAIAHQWRKGDVVLWANMAVMHRRDAFDPAARRVLHRAQIAALA